MTTEIHRDQYLTDFPENTRRSALEEARENRKFEIELYWKRAAYFWTFIAAAFGGYFLIEERTVNTSLSYIVCCLGFILSLGWYFVNRGSKYWQENWEMHVDLLENDITGPLYKTILQASEDSFGTPHKPYPFSVSKVNQLISLFAVLVWFVLMARTVAVAMHLFETPHHLTLIGMTLITIVMAIILFRKGRTESLADDDIRERFYRRTRTYR